MTMEQLLRQTPPGRSLLDGGVLQLPVYTVSGLPSVTPAGRLIHVSDESGGAVPAFSDGTNWRRVTDTVIVS